MHILHHNDSDGRLAAYIVARRSFQGPPPVDKDMFIEMTYDKPVPFDKITKGASVWIVDFSISPEDMKKLLDITPNVTWIDHHKSAIERYKDWDGPEIKGIREIGKSGCLLTWEYLHHTAPAPDWVAFVDDYDIWAFKYGDDTRNFYFGVMTEDVRPGPDCIWERLWDEEEYAYDIVNAGRAIRKFISNMYNDQLDHAYGITYDGLMCLVLNTPNRGSGVFGDMINSYDMCMSYFWNGKQWQIGLYSIRDDVDCSKQAMKLGGGGHKGAAGAHVNALPAEFGKMPCIHSSSAQHITGSQTRETLEEAGATVHKRLSPTEVILEIDGNFELWSEKDDYAGYVIEVDEKGYEFVSEYAANPSVASNTKGDRSITE
jgi:oligoribonuclease NrnB/cAMP/cGMP phosphodiesterase (DHH superfamily)